MIRLLNFSGPKTSLCGSKWENPPPLSRWILISEASFQSRCQCREELTARIRFPPLFSPLDYGLLPPRVPTSPFPWRTHFLSDLPLLVAGGWGQCVLSASVGLQWQRA